MTTEEQLKEVARKAAKSLGVKFQTLVYKRTYRSLLVRFNYPYVPTPFSECPVVQAVKDAGGLPVYRLPHDKSVELEFSIPKQQPVTSPTPVYKREVKLVFTSTTQEISLQLAIEGAIEAWQDTEKKAATKEERTTAAYSIEELKKLHKQLKDQKVFQ